LKRLNEVLSDENQKNVRDTLRNVRNGTQQLEAISKDTSALAKESRLTVKQLSDTLRKADVVLDDLQKTTKPFGERGPTIFKNFDESSESLNRTLRDVRELIQLAARSDGT